MLRAGKAPVCKRTYFASQCNVRSLACPLTNLSQSVHQFVRSQLQIWRNLLRGKGERERRGEERDRKRRGEGEERRGKEETGEN